MDVCSSDGSTGPMVVGCRADFDFTVRFEHVFLSIVPSAIFIAWAVLRLGILVRRENVTRGIQLWAAKLGFAAVYVAVQLAMLILICQHSIEYVSRKTELAAAVLALVDAVVVLVLLHFEQKKSRRPSLVLNTYLFLTILFDGAQARTMLLVSSNWHLPRWAFSNIAIKAIILLLENVPKQPIIPTKLGPEATIGIWAMGWFTWLNKLIRTGSKGVIKLEDLYPLQPDVTAEATRERFAKVWTQQKRDETHPAWALIKAEVKTLKWNLLYPVPSRLANVGFTFCQPFLLRRIVQFLSEPSSSNKSKVGAGLIGATLIIYLGKAFTRGLHGYQHGRALAMCRGFLVTAIFQQTVTLTTTSGEVADAAITLMSTDVQRIDLAFSFVHEIWANAIELGLAAWLLYREIGVAFLSPIIVTIVCIFAISPIAIFGGKRQGTWMKATETRVAATANMVTHMKSLKLSGLSSQLLTLVQDLRKDELKKAAAFRALQVFAFIVAFGPMIFSPIFAFAVTRRTLDTGRMFTSISYLMLFTNPLTQLLQLIPEIIAALACCGRVAKFLYEEQWSDHRSFEDKSVNDESRSSSPSIEAISWDTQNAKSSVPQVANPSNVFTVENGSFYYKKDTIVLRNINLAIKADELALVVGPVGSGKSSLCRALLGEIPLSEGKVNCIQDYGSIGFCDQTPFLPNGSIQDVITSYSRGDFDQLWYDRVIQATALRPDFSTFTNGDLSTVGTDGISLSGGQKARIALARALYARPSIFVFDDILSGLDTTTASYIVDEVFSKSGLLHELKATTVMCTHAVEYLSLADHIIALDSEGTIVEDGTWEDLRKDEGYIGSLKVKTRQETETKPDVVQEKRDEPVKPKASALAAQLDESARQTGDMRLYKHFFSILGPLLWIWFPGAIAGGFLFNFGTIWLKIWSDDVVDTTRQKHTNNYYLGVYGMIQVLCLAMLMIFAYFNMVSMTVRAGKTFHLNLLRSTMSATLTFFTTTDVGLTINRFSQDLTIIDVELCINLLNVTILTVASLGQAVNIALGSPYLAISYPFLMAILYFITTYYLKTSRQMRLLDMEMKSPLYTHFLESLKGITTIRSFGWTKNTITHSNELFNASQNPYYLFMMLQHWLTASVGIVIAILAVVFVTLAVQLRSDAGFIAVGIIGLMQFSEFIENIIRSYTMLETSMGAVSRLKTFSDTVESEDRTNEDIMPSQEWPQRGQISIRGVSASYDPSVEDDTEPGRLALRNISLDIAPGEKVAICGRTGSGKSSMVLLLLKLLDPIAPQHGNIIIDDIPLHKINRTALRSQIIAIPQDPFFYKGDSSAIKNLDPFGKATIKECEAVLEEVGLLKVLLERGALDTPLNVDTLSQGQKQLFSLARAVLRGRLRNANRDQQVIGEKKPSSTGGILLLDEISSSVDTSTDELIQQVIRKEFSGYTIIAIAHRQKTIEDFDRVVVMENGRVKEVGSPATIFAKEEDILVKE